MKFVTYLVDATIDYVERIVKELLEMNKYELIEINDHMFRNINYYVIHHDFKLEVYNITNNKRIVMNNDGLGIMFNFIDYKFNKIITQIIIRSTDKTIKVFVRDKKELENEK